VAFSQKRKLRFYSALRSLFPNVSWNQSWPIDIRFILYTYSFTVIPDILAESSALKTTKIFNLWVLEKALLGIAFLVLVILMKSVLEKLKNRMTILLEVFVIGILAGAFTGFLDVKLQYSLDLTMSEHFVFVQLFSFALTGALWLPIGGAIAFGPNQLKVRRAMLMRESDAIARTQLRQNQTLKSMRSFISKSLASQLQETAEALKKNAPQVSVLATVNRERPEFAKNIIEWNLASISALRTLSHQLVEPSETQSSRGNPHLPTVVQRFIGFFKLISDSLVISLKARPLSPYLFTAVICVFSAYPALRFEALTEGLIRFTTLTLVTLFTMISVFAIRQRVKTIGWLVDLFGVSLLMAMPWVIPYFTFINSTRSFEITKKLTYDIVVLIVYISAHIGQALLITNAEILDTLDKRNQENRIREKILNEQIAIFSRDWASHIHGRVVTRLTSAAFLLEQSSAKNSSSSINAALEIIAETLEEPESGIQRNQSNKTLEDEVNYRLDPWDGILNVTADIDPQIRNLGGSRVFEIGLIIEEAVTNSVRHGQASSVAVALTPKNPQSVSLIILDNSTVAPPVNFPIESSMGLGTQIFDSFTDGRWTLSHDVVKKETTLRAEISVA
jgi:two-component sensor histidine kinase